MKDIPNRGGAHEPMGAQRPVFPPAARWRRQAACRGVDPELFFLERGESSTPARATCAGCPVRAECLAHALAAEERLGIWGGTTPRERQRIRRQRRETAA